MSDRTKWLVSTQWLEDHLNSPDVQVIDSSWHLPNEGRDPAAEFAAEHIPGAIYFDMDAVADLSTGLQHMLPSSDFFSQEAGKLGLSNNKLLVIYDVVGLKSAPRVWWTFRTMGVEDVYILDGGLPKWKAEGRAVTNEKTILPPARFDARLFHGAVRNHADMLAAIEDDTVQIVDARAEGRWRGVDPEPRPHLSSGRMPGSKNVPYMMLLDENGCLKDVDALRQIFESRGVDLGKPIITTCGSGATAAVLTLALDTLGHSQLGLYDGSWSEWASREDSPIERDD